MTDERIAPERWVVSALVLAWLAPMLAVGFSALGIPPLPVGVAALLIASLCCRPIAQRLPREWDGLGSRRSVLCVLWLVLALAAVVRSAGVALFMADAQQAQASALWFDPFYIQHSCFSAWWKAAELARDGVDNIYESAPYAGMEGRFKLDDFLYLPQFLILPRAGIATGASFLQLRAAWFAIESGLAAFCLLLLTVWIGGRHGRRMALLIPAVWLSTPFLLTLQIGNFQLAAISMSLLAMYCFESERPIAGGALLGFAAFKLFPGLLGVYLLFTRRWRALFWTTLFFLAYSVVAYLEMGSKPFSAFWHYELPRIANGDAWAWLENDGMAAVISINDSVPGMVLKLREMGVPGMSRAVETLLSLFWTLVVVGLTILAALRSGSMSRVERLASWLALLSMAAFRSPFVPDTYGLLPLVWLWSVLAAGADAGRRTIGVFVLLWIALALSLPFGGMPMPGFSGRMAISTASQLIAIALSLWVILRRAPAHSVTAISQPAVSTHYPHPSSA